MSSGAREHKACLSLVVMHGLEHDESLDCCWIDSGPNLETHLSILKFSFPFHQSISRPKTMIIYGH